ncbi:HTH domain-containing protein [Aeoliella sp. ICT_H6.2]|uniref:HTH domain-containing protein n=1 Tax=Aeoliella straminimaris TaxID=2954799 RepID=A0A9X2JFH9_9BACT|nr:HTH domain-containing protein [Aeoliella straminimaris]MCO6043332.1 HTH domain-containing protein [Aeoliella straminimaris]
MNNVMNAITHVLTEADGPLHYREITKRALASGLWKTRGTSPEATVNAHLSGSIKRDGSKSPFRKHARGVYGLATAGSSNGAASEDVENDDSSMSYTEAAVHVLEEYADGQPMHYRDITNKILELGLVETASKTPEATLNAQLHMEMQRREKRGEEQRFDRRGKGMFGLVSWKPTGLEGQIRKRNEEVRRKLHERVAELTPEDFEILVGQLLTALGFEEVEVTKISSDGGIDVRGTLVVGDAIRTRMAVQAKKWKNNVQAPVVQQVRGSLGSHEQGLIITTSDFSKGAREEAQRPDAIPVGLMNGQQLVSLLIEHGIGVRRTTHDILALDELREGEE